MTKEQKQKKEIAEATILNLYKKYANKKKETTAKAVSFFLRGVLKNVLRRDVLLFEILPLKI